MKVFKIIALLVLVHASTYAQNTPVRSISLKQAYELGIQNRFDVQANNLDVDLANNTTEKSKKEWLPNIEATGDVKYNTQLETMVFPDGFDGSGQPQIITMGTKNLSIFALDLTQSIFNSGLNTYIKIAKNEALLEQEKNREKEIAIKQRIAQAYLNVILKNLQLKLAKATTGRYAQYYELADKKHSLGTLIDNDLLKTKLDFENSKISALEAQQNYNLAMLQLKYQLNISNEEQIILTDSIESLQKENIITLENTGIKNRTEMQQLMLESESNRLELKKSKQFFLPTLSFVANYTTQYQGEDFKYNETLWSPFNYLGMKLSIPITDNLKNSNTIKEYQLRIEQDKFELLQKESDIDYEIERTKTELLNAQNLIRSTKNNLDLSSEIHTTQLNIYKLGSTTTYSNILDNENSMTTAEQNYIKAVYNFLIATINYEKSIGKL